MKYVIYTRISSKQQKEGTSPETQLEDCRKVVGRKPYVHIHDTAKGWLPTEDRSKLNAAINQLNKGDVLLVRTADRLCRNVEEMGVIKYLVRIKGAKIQCVIGDFTDADLHPGDWLVSRVLSHLPEYEIRILAARMKRCHAKKRENNEAMGTPPYGLKIVDGKLVEDEEQQETLKMIKSLKDQGLSQRAIVAILNEAGMYNTVGKPWTKTPLAKIMQRL